MKPLLDNSRKTVRPTFLESGHAMLKVMLLTSGYAVSLMILVGCSEDTGGRVAVSGQVSVNGEPLKRGRIVFTPAEGNTGPTAGGAIEDGHFTILATGGPVAGAYQIKVKTDSLPSKKEKMGMQSPNLTPQENQTFEFIRIISADGENYLDFDLASADSEPSS